MEPGGGTKASDRPEILLPNRRRARPKFLNVRRPDQSSHPSIAAAGRWRSRPRHLQPNRRRYKRSSSLSAQRRRRGASERGFGRGDGRLAARFFGEAEAEAALVNGES